MPPPQSPKRFSLLEFLRGHVLLLACLVLIPAQARSEDKSEIKIVMDERAQKAAGIAAEQIEADTMGQDVSFPGVVIVPPHQASVVASPAAGLVEEVLVTQDEFVRAGQVIARLRSPDVVEAQRLLLAALTDERLAEDKLRRSEALLKVKAIAEVQAVLARGEHTHAVARVEERLQILQLMGVTAANIEELRNTRRISSTIEVYAPKDGTIIERTAKQGQRVEAAAPLFTVATLSPLWISIQVPTVRMSLMREGKTVFLPAQSARGRVIRVGRTIDPSTQSISVIAEIDTNAGSVRPGLSTSVSVRYDVAPGNRWSVPIASVVRHRGQSWVFVKTADGFVARAITIVSETSQRASIEANFQVNELIASKGLMTLAAELAESDGR